ncbi:Metallo-dependent hydrolase [Amylocystis lapponica]|nr:Metallo-dependent hydrolase [Amylocystis lapponica]
MASTSYLLKGGIVATYTSDNKPKVFNADVLVAGSTIVKIEENINVGPEVEVIDVTDKWVTPGLVDTHRHVFMAVLRGDQDDWLLSEYLCKMSWNLQSALTADEVRVGQLAGCMDAIENGVTTVLDHFHAATTPEHAEKCLDATVQSGLRVIWCPARQSGPTQLFPNFEYANEEETAKWQMEKLKEWATRDNGKLSPDGRVTLGLAVDQEVFKYARELGVAMITAHVVKGPRILIMRDAGLLGPDVIFSHCNELHARSDPDDEMWTAMKDYDVAIASTPVDELGMAHGNPVAMDAVRRGVRCGLGADAISINGGDLFQQMRMALQFARGRGHEATELGKLTPPKTNEYYCRDAFRLATLGGAEALNLGHLVGTVEVGKRADLVVFDTDSANLAGIADPFAGITFHATNADVEHVFVNGELLKRAGKLTRNPWSTVAKELKRTAQGVRERMPNEKLHEIWEKYYATLGTPSWG